MRNVKTWPSPFARFLFLPVVLCFLFGCQTLSPDKNLIDKSLSECIDKSGCITIKMMDCLTVAYKEWEEEVDHYYKLLMDVLPNEAKIELDRSQAAWIKFKDLEFEAIPIIYSGTIGSFQGPTFIEHKVDILKARAQELRAYYEKIKDE